MKLLFFILVLTFSAYGKPAENVVSGKHIPNTEPEPQTGKQEVVHKKTPRQDEDGDDGDDGGGIAQGLASGLGNILGGASGSGGSSSVTGLLLNGLTGGLFAGFIPGETGQAVSNLYNQFTDPLNKFLEVQINAGVKNLLASTTLKTKATSLSPTTPQSNVIVQEVAIQEVSSQQLSSNQVGGSAVGSSGGHTLLSAEKLSSIGNQLNPQQNYNQQNPQQNYNQQNPQQNNNQQNPQQQYNQKNPQQQYNQQNPQQQYNQKNPQQQYNQQIPQQQYNQQNPQQQLQNEIRRKEPYITNLADLKYINGNQQRYAVSSSPFPGNGIHASTGTPSNNQQFQGTQNSNNIERTTEDDDGDDGDDEDNNRI